MASAEQQDTPMEDSLLEASIHTATSTTGKSKRPAKARMIFHRTLSRPPFAYAQIEVVTGRSAAASADEQTPLDALQARSYCTAALQQFLGASGAGMPLDLLQIDGHQFWVRLPREDLGLFAAALAAWGPASQSGTPVMLRLRASGNWLGSLIGRSEQQALWETV